MDDQFIVICLINNSFNPCDVHVVSGVCACVCMCVCVSHLCELLWRCGQNGHSAVKFGKEFIRQVSQTGPACPFQDHPQTSLNLQHFGALEPTPRWACQRHTQPHMSRYLSIILLLEMKVNFSGALRKQAILKPYIDQLWNVKL